jgi:hypothetical protein
VILDGTLPITTQGAGNVPLEAHPAALDKGFANDLALDLGLDWDSDLDLCSDALDVEPARKAG